ncbi:MAG: collagen-like protein [Saprospiraceae bacterium]
MKQVLTILSFFVFISVAVAQAPQGINYQGVARDATTKPLPAGTAITLGFKIRDVSGAELYSETQTRTTNGVGLFTAVIGVGSPNPGSGSFANISWGTSPKFLEVIVNGQSGGSQPLQSVPYALYAASGNPGPKGDKGDTGAPGTKGDKGDPGAQGATGAQGAPGAKGDKGDPGAQGATGAQGAQGAKGDAGAQGPAGTSINASDVMVGPENFKTSVRSGAWQTMESKLQVQAPSTGTYLILYTLRAKDFTDQDVVYFKIANALTGADYTSSVLMSPANGLNDVSASSFFITTLSQGETVQVREKMEGSGTNEVIFQDGRLSLIKL